ncbi:MAG: hypothetical protein U1F35_19225 [Steroidobacteraceae bacterium]
MKNSSQWQHSGIRGRCVRIGAVLTLASALTLSATAATTAPAGGVLVTHMNSQSWSISVIGGGTARHFAGTVDSSAPITGVTRVKMESSDSAVLTTANQLTLSMSAKPGTDTVQFTAPTTAKLCIRSTGGGSVPLYLGDSLEVAVAITAPYSLAGTDACGTGGGGGGGTTDNRKKHAGHYVALTRGQDTQAIMAATLKPGVAGFMKRYTWRSLEPSMGAYNLAEIKSDLDWAASYGMHLIVMIEDKTFTMERPTPSYLDAYTLVNRAGGYTAVRWSTNITSRWKALVKAIGSQFDSNAAFEGIATQETSLGFDDATLNANGYTPEKYRDAYIDMFTDAGKSLPTSHIFWFMNFFARNQDYIASVAAAVASSGVVMGGPDVMPDNKALQSRTYPLYSQFHSKLPLFGQVEDVCYSQLHATSGYKTKYWTMPELFGYARDNLHVNYMIWVRVPNASPSDSYDYEDALPVMATNPTFN